MCSKILPKNELAIGGIILLLAACNTVETSSPPSPTILSTSIPPAAITPVSASPTYIPTPIDVSGLASHTQTPMPPQAPYGIEIFPGYEINQIFRPALLMPCDVRVGPDGRIFFTEWEGHRILELGNDGTISTFLELEKAFCGLLINSIGDIFVMQGDELIKISSTGERRVFAKTGAGGWAFDSQDNLYVIESGNLSRFSPDGEKTFIGSGVINGSMAIGPSGDIYIAAGSTGQILKVTQNGVVSILADGFAHDAFNIAFDNQGNLYQNANYFTQVSLENGSLSSPILKEYNVLLVSRPFAFTPSGDAIFIGPTSNNAFLASIQNNTVSVLLGGIGNSRALAVDLFGNVFMGGSNEFPLVPGRVVQITPAGEVYDFATGFFTIRDLILDIEGNMFVSDFDNEGDGGGRLFKISLSGHGSIIISGFYDLSSMVYEPDTGDILAFEEKSHQLIRLTQGGTVTSIPVDFGGEAITIDLSLDDGGDLIALVVFLDGYNTGPVHRGLYRISKGYQATLITNIDTPKATSEDDVFVNPSGDIFVIGPEEHPYFRLLKITPEGEVSVVARNLPYDTLSLTISNSGDIYFTCSAGMFKVTQK